MAHIGSVFLGDVQRQRILSTSTPPSSPPPHLSPTSGRNFPDPILENAATTSNSIPAAQTMPSKVTPEVAVELRTRLLETLVMGAQRDARTAVPRPDVKTATVIRDLEEVQRKLDTLVQSSGSDALKWFVDNCTSSRLYGCQCLYFI